jgi:hypothetical protein
MNAPIKKSNGSKNFSGNKYASQKKGRRAHAGSPYSPKPTVAKLPNQG